MIHIEYLGYNMYVGNTSSENNYLINNSKPDDYWIHINNYSSAHGIIINPSLERIPIKIIKYLCCYIKKKSNKCNSIKNLMFDVTKIKYLQLTNVPGQVIIKHNLKQITI
jgi:hypothetical protein